MHRLIIHESSKFILFNDRSFIDAIFTIAMSNGICLYVLLILICLMLKEIVQGMVCSYLANFYGGEPCSQDKIRNSRVVLTTAIFNREV